jgi:hypothetical protein
VTVRATGSGGSFTLRVTVSRGACTCVAEKTVTIGGSRPPCTITSSRPGICPGQTAELCGPDGNFSYSWSPGGQTTRCITASVADQTYTLTVTDRVTGCTNSCSFELPDLPEPPCEISASKSSICNGETSTLCGPEGSNFRYSWSTGETSRCIDVDHAGRFSLTVTDQESHCTKTCSIDIGEGNAPSCTISGPSSLPAGSTGTLCGPDGSHFSYKWSTGETSRCITVGPGHFSLTVTDDQTGCKSTCSATVNEIPQIPCVCSLGYPDNSNPPRSQLSFGAQLALKAYTPCPNEDLVLKAWYNSDHPVVLGVRRVIVKTSSGSTTTDYPVTPNPSSPSCVMMPDAGATGLSGDQAGTDKYDRPVFPALFVTDITDDPSSRSGDWEQKATVAYPPTKICGRWKAAIRTVDKTSSPPKVTITTDSDPSSNDWNLGSGADEPPGGLSSLPTLGWGSEVAWDLRSLGLIPGHTYRLYFMLHKGKSTDGDAAHACATVQIPVVVTSATNVDATRQGFTPPASNAVKLPGQYELMQNFPNPFHPTTTIRFALPERSAVRLSVFTVLGREVTTLVDGEVDAGYRSVEWKAVDKSGRVLPPGIYLYRLQARSLKTGEFHQVRKMVLLK